MKVRELIEGLSMLDPELDVYTQGCDCDAEAEGVGVDDYGDPHVMIYRYREGWWPKRTLPWPIRPMADALAAGLIELARIEHEAMQTHWDDIARQLGGKF